MPRQKSKESKESDVNVAELLWPKVLEAKESLLLECSGWEKTWIGLQRTLSMENPVKTVGVYLLVNIAFWIGSSLRFYTFVGVAGMLCCLACIIGPKVLEFFHSGEEEESDNDFIPFSTLCEYGAVVYVYGKHCICVAALFRIGSPFWFFVISIFLCAWYGALGYFISGFQIVYFFTMALMIYPASRRNSLTKKVHAWIRPYIKKAEEHMNIKRPSKRPRDEESDDEILNEFVPDQPVSKTSSTPAEDSAKYDSCHPTSSENEPVNPFVAGLILASTSYADTEGDVSAFEPDSSIMPSLSQLDNSLTVSENEMCLDAGHFSLTNTSMMEAGEPNESIPVAEETSKGLESSTEDGFEMVDPDKDLAP